jgi:hypothetical protein
MVSRRPMVGTYCNLFAALRTRRRTSGATSGLLFKALDTVAGESFNSLARSRMDAIFFTFFKRKKQLVKLFQLQLS